MRSAFMPWTAVLILSATAVAASVDAEMEPKTSELHGGRWIDITNPTTQIVDNSLLRIENLIQDRKYDQARKSALEWIKHNHGSPLYDRGLYLTAEALYQYGD